MKSTFIQFAASLGVTFTPAQRILYGTAFDGAPVPDDEVGAALFGFAGERPDAAKKTLVLVKGARIGGTRFGALAGLHRALSCPLTSLSPGERAFVFFCAPDMRHAREGLSFVRIALEQKPALRRLIASDSENLLVIRRPDKREVHFVCLPATAGGSALRGRWYAFAHFVEAAYFRDSNYAINDADCYSAVAPRIVPGGNILLESTPWAEAGLVFDLHKDNFGDPKTALVAQAPTRLMRTDDPELLADVDREYKRDPQNAAQEYGAVFLSAGTGLFFDPTALDKCIDPTLELPSPPLGTAHAGADWAFESDSSALVIADATKDDAGDTRVAIAYIEELQPKRGEPLKTSVVVECFARVVKLYRGHSICADAHYRQAIIEYLEKHGVQLEDAPAGRPGKTQVYIRARELVNAGRVRLPAHDRLIAQLKAIISRPVPENGMAISSPRRGKGGGHGDLASAFVLACWLATGGETGAADYSAMMKNLTCF